VKPFIARWDLDKTYLRTEFDSLRDLVRTAFERADQKRTVPGAGSLLRELSRSGARIHILSGSPRQMRGRIEEKLRLDGAKFESLTLKPNLENFLRLRLRAVRDQLGYKLPALLRSRATLSEPLDNDKEVIREVLLGDDAEADAFVYSLYADICSGKITDIELADIMRKGGTYEDAMADALRFARLLEKGNVVERILIHLERQSSPSNFSLFGPRVVPFYNYLQAAVVLAEDGRLPAAGVVRVAAEMVMEHRFDAERLARSYVDLKRRGCVQGTLIAALRESLEELSEQTRLPVLRELNTMCDRLDVLLPNVPEHESVEDVPMPDYLNLVVEHNSKRKGKKWKGLLVD
jgi:hypothetical protein